MMSRRLSSAANLQEKPADAAVLPGSEEWTAEKKMQMWGENAEAGRSEQNQMQNRPEGCLTAAKVKMQTERPFFWQMMHMSLLRSRTSMGNGHQAGQSKATDRQLASSSPAEFMLELTCCFWSTGLAIEDGCIF